MLLLVPAVADLRRRLAACSAGRRRMLTARSVPYAPKRARGFDAAMLALLLRSSRR